MNCQYHSWRLICHSDQLDRHEDRFVQASRVEFVKVTDCISLPRGATVASRLRDGSFSVNCIDFGAICLVKPFASANISNYVMQ